VMNSVSTLAVRDFVLHVRPRTGERAQVLLGRFAIVVATLLGVMAAYAVYKTPDGLYKYLQAVTLYLTLPVAPAIVFGILSKRVTAMGALASVLVGSVFSVVFVTDQLIGSDAGSKLFPWLHTGPLTLNYTYRGLWGTIACIITLFGVSAFTRKTDPAKLERLTIDWKGRAEPFRGIFDWRLQLALLSAVTVVLYWLLW
jgi:SSS family solute:Na+ symporter